MYRDNNPEKTALRIAVVYIITGVFWILVTDKIVKLCVGEKGLILFVNIIKGWLFVAVSGLIIFLLVRGALKKLKKVELKLKESMYFDPFSGMPNYLSLKEKFDALVHESEENALMLVDIDNFKYINDTYGYEFGNRLINVKCEMLRRLIGDSCSIFGLGGDKFIILAEKYSDLYEIEKLAVKILKGLKNPVEIDGKMFHHTASIGVSLYPHHGDNLDELLKCAEIALFKAKETGKNRIVIYSEPMKNLTCEWMNIERLLRTALDNNEFDLYYQPQYDVRENRITGFETLIRWRSDELGFALPNMFIKVAEDTHMILPIGEWVLRNACIFLKRILQEGYNDITVSVNVSKLQLMQDDFVDTVLDIVEMTGVNPGNLEIEISGSYFQDSFDIIEKKIDILEKRNVKIGIHDFGKGCSYFKDLRNLPVKTLKIDRSVVENLSSSEEYRMLADFLVRIGRNLNLCIMAEGVETQEQFDYIASLGCNKMQGYFFSRPLPEKDAFEKLRNNFSMQCELQI